MIKINNFWVDNYNNKWHCNHYSKEQALQLSNTLTNCYNCNNCKNCNNCINCNDCRDCENCHDCNYCSECSDCRCCNNCNNCDNCRNCQASDYCSYCYYSNGCSYCSYCHHCSSCNYCGECKNCQRCENYKGNPQRYVTSKIGSRNDQTIFYHLDGDIQIICGCFTGNLQDFEEKVKEKHGDNRYSKQYLEEIVKVKVLFDIKEVK